MFLYFVTKYLIMGVLERLKWHFPSLVNDRLTVFLIFWMLMFC